MTMKAKLAIAATAAVLLVTAVLLKFSTGVKAAASTVAEPNVQPVAVAIIKRTPLVQTITLSGEFKPFQDVEVHAKVAGYIRKMYVDVGDRVKQGQTLATLEVPELDAQLAGADASVRRAKDSIRLRQSEVKREESLHSATHFGYTRLKQASAARPGLIAEQELDDALAKDQESEAQIGVSQAALSEAQNQLAVAQASYRQLEAMASYTRIEAPFDGVVTERYADNGSLIQAGTASNTQAMPVVRIAEYKKLRLVLPVPESAVPDIHLGDVVKVNVAALNRTFDGKVARFADALNRQTRTMETEVDVENRNGTLVDGMYAEVNLVLRNDNSVLTVPLQAVTRNGSKATVLLVDPTDRLEEREVKLGVEGNDRAEVLSGLAANDRVVIGSRSQFRVGERVQPKPMQQAENIGESEL